MYISTLVSEFDDVFGFFLSFSNLEASSPRLFILYNYPCYAYVA